MTTLHLAAEGACVAHRFLALPAHVLVVEERELRVCRRGIRGVEGGTNVLGFDHLHVGEPWYVLCQPYSR